MSRPWAESTPALSPLSPELIFTMYDKAHFDWDRLPPLTSPRRQLGLKGVALGLINLPPGKGYTFTHRHREQEEVYIVLSGSGRLLVDGEMVPLDPGDVVRVDPESKRALKNDGALPLRIICAGGVPAGYPHNPEARYLIDDGVPDYDDVPPWYAGEEAVSATNAGLKQRYLRSLRRGEKKKGNE
jgi:quercetin dioxygenase-like cupin family protein